MNIERNRALNIIFLYAGYVLFNFNKGFNYEMVMFFQSLSSYDAQFGLNYIVINEPQIQIFISILYFGIENEEQVT